MEEEGNEINIPGWALILITILLICGITLMFLEGYSLYILGTALALSVITLILAQVGILSMDFKITKDEDEDEKNEQEDKK